MNGWVGWMEGRISVRMDGWMDLSVDKLMNGLMYGID